MQSSQCNYDGTGRFTVNVGSFFPGVSARRGLPVIGIPKEADSTIRARIGQLMPGGDDYWWTVEADTDLPMLAVEVAVLVVDYGLIWLERMLDLPTVLEALTVQGNPLMAASVALELGLQDRALVLLHSALHDRPMAEVHIRSFAERNGCRLD